jgi:putative ABC transport system substrate-binding protein
MSAFDEKRMKKGILFSVLITFMLPSLYRADASAQSKKLPRIAFIFSTGSPAATSLASPLFEAFHLGLRDLGYMEGKNVLIERRYAEGRLDRMPGLVNELVQQKVDVILAPNNVVIRAAQAATKTIPIVVEQARTTGDRL